MAQFKNTGLLGTKSAAADNIQQLPSPLSNRILPSAQLFPLITFSLSFDLKVVTATLLFPSRKKYNKTKKKSRSGNEGRPRSCGTMEASVMDLLFFYI